MIALLPIQQKAWPGFLGLADKHEIGKVAKIVFADADPRTAHHGERAVLFEFGQDLAHAQTLHHHPGDADDVGFGAACEIDRFDIFIDDRDAVLRRGQRRKQWQRSHWQRRALADEWQGVLEPPKRKIKTRVD